MSGLGEAAPAARPLTLPAETPAPLVAPAPAPVSSDPTITDATYQWIAKVFAVALAVSTCAIVGVLCYRVALDGNSATTEAITQQLADNVKWLVLGLAAVILGKNAISALIAKFTGGS